MPWKNCVLFFRIGSVGHMFRQFPFLMFHFRNVLFFCSRTKRLPLVSLPMCEPSYNAHVSLRKHIQTSRIIACSVGNLSLSIGVLPRTAPRLSHQWERVEWILGANVPSKLTSVFTQETGIAQSFKKHKNAPMCKKNNVWYECVHQESWCSITFWVHKHFVVVYGTKSDLTRFNSITFISVIMQRCTVIHLTRMSVLSKSEGLHGVERLCVL